MRPKTLSSSKVTKALPVRERLSENQITQLKTAFDLFDQTNTGTIDPFEIQKILQELGLDKRNQVVFNMISDLQSKNKPIDFEEFIEIIYSRLGDCKTIDGLQRVFALYDTTGDGFIDLQKMKHAAKELGQVLSQEELVQMMHNTHILNDTQTNEAFSFEEFYHIVTRKKY